MDLVQREREVPEYQYFSRMTFLVNGEGSWLKMQIYRELQITLRVGEMINKDV